MRPDPPVQTHVQVLDKSRARLCLSAGGSKGFVHIGALKRLDEESDLNLVEVSGASVGALVAVFYTNGYAPEKIAEIFAHELGGRSEIANLLKLLPDPLSFALGGWQAPGQYAPFYDFAGGAQLQSVLNWFDPLKLASSSGWLDLVRYAASAPPRQLANLNRALSTWDPVSLLVGGLLDLRRPMQELCQRYNLRPDARLTMYACDLLRHKLVKISGCDYDLPELMTAVCALPGLFRPVWRVDDSAVQLLGDAARYHYSPPDDFEETAIFSVFESSTQMPSTGSVLDLYLSAREVFQWPLAGDNRQVDADKHLVMVTKPRWPGLFFDLGAADIAEMVDLGYATMGDALQKWRAAGRI